MNYIYNFCKTVIKLCIMPFAFTELCKGLHNSVNAYTLRLTPIFIELVITICDLQSCISSSVS